MILIDILEEHIEEADFLWQQRKNELSDRVYNLNDLAEIEERLPAHLDGLVLGEKEAWRMLEPKLTGGELGEVFTAAFVALDSMDAERIDLVIKTFGQADGDIFEGIRHALRHSSYPEIERIVRPCLTAEKKMVQSAYPVLSESAMETIPSDQPVVKLHEWSPLVRSQVKWLRKMLAPIVLDPYIREFFSLPATGDTRSKVRRHEILMELDEYIGEVFSTTPPDGWHPDDMALVQFTARGLLAGTLCTFNSSRSHFDWIQTMVSISTGELDWKKHPSKLPSHLGMIPANAVLKAEQLHEYAVDFKIGGFAGELFASVGGWIGALTVEKKSPPTWKRMYDVVFAQIGAGFSIGVQIGQQNDGTARSSLAYTADDIPGSCTLMASGVHAGLISAGPGMLIINGRTLPPLAFNLTSLDSGNLELGGGVDVLTFMQGWIFRPFIKNHRSKPHPAKILRDEEFSATGHHADEIHFRLGDALLTEDARQLLRIVCARELKSFSDCGSILAIVGHADRVDTEERNIELSKLRAFNTLQAIKDILGNDLRIMPEKTSLSAMGEERAKEGGDVDGFPNPKWRKVEIIINHRLVLNLRGE